MIDRAIYDPKVISAWSALVARHGKGGWVRIGVFAIVAAAFVVFMSFPGQISAAVLVLTAVALVFSVILDQRPAAKCPHCNHSPKKLYHRGFAIDSECCAHCNYWLVSPYGSDQSNTQA